MSLRPSASFYHGIQALATRADQRLNPNLLTRTAEYSLTTSVESYFR